MTLAEFKTEVLPTLTLAEQMELVEALHSQGLNEAPGSKHDAWDLQMIEDCKPGGVLYRLGEEAEESFKRGECLPDWP